MTILRIIYNLAFPLVVIGMLPWLIQRMIRRGKYRHKFGQRFSIYSRRVRARLKLREWTWIHAVSVGEVLIALKFMRELKAQDDSRRFVLSTTTSTGFALASENRCSWIEPIYNPMDFFLFTWRALDLIRPKQIILIEAEVWPNLVTQAKNRGIPAFLVNARLSPRSEARFRKFRFFTAPLFNQLTAICVPDEEDVERWTRMGVSKDKIIRTGSIKFDEPESKTTSGRDFWPILESFGVKRECPIFLGASTHAGEELALARVFLDLREQVPGLVFLSVPRHAERARSVVQELHGIGLRVGLRSEFESAVGSDPVDAVVVDTTGELRDWYRCATVVFVGKSLLHRGGQNPAEPIGCGCPVIVGPHMRNFDVLVRQLVRHHGIVQVDSAAAIAPAATALLSSPERRNQLVANGRNVIASHRGATRRTCDVIARWKS
jgi:3-deoxy-D-manno-octulosonic-acid transferase